MSLSTDLVSQFVKITNDNTNTKKETVLYGTIVTYKTDPNSEPEFYVQIDGSDLLTPYTSTAVVKNGDRVTLTVKNHTAIVTGNITDPSASSGTVTNLANNTITTGQLTAVNAKIDTLTTKQATFETVTTERLDAAEATIKNLTGVDANFVTVTTQRLDAAEADIDNLEAGVADIDTLIFGSATGTTIQTSFSNAVIAQLGDAQIKSAMIDNVSASKITAGDISTNNVRILSDDGRMLLSDETIQISDANRVRVQIGKDASNDYSINIWDQNGNLMFSKGGITDAAIKEAIIRNDMVSDTANIAAHKLDIDSLFDEINGSTNTIKSTKVKLDEANQTLDVAFKSMSDTVTSQGETITSQGTAISTIQGQITSKIWQQDIDTAKGEMSTQYSTLEQEVDSFKTSVSETYATIEDMDSISVGGRNYIIPSKIATYPDYTTVQSADESVISLAFKSSYGTSAAGSYLTMRVDGYTPPDEIMTLSGYIKVNGVIPESNYFLTQASTYGETEIVNSYDSSTGRFVCTQRYNGSSIWIIHAVVARKTNAEDVVTFEKLKFEKGMIPTDWTPAPEDIDTRVTAAESSITQLSNKITANVTETTNLGTRMSTVEQTASGLTAKLDGLAIGGRNLLRNSRLIAMSSNNSDVYPTQCVETTENGVKFYRVKRINTATYPSATLSVYSTIPKTSFAYGEMTGKQATLSFKARVSHEITAGFMDFTYGGSPVVDFGKSSEKFTTEWKTYYITVDEFPDMTNHTGIRWNPYNFQLTEEILDDFYLDICDYKFELGNKPTDWSPAPEDVDSDISDAAKTATNYLNFSNGGLVVGDMTSSTLGKNVLIDSDSVDIRNGTTTLASFGANTVTLGRNAEDSVIDLCDGAGRISANTAEAATSFPNRNAILIDSQEIETESVRFVASTSNKYGASSTPSIVRGTELYMQRSSSSGESCARLKAEHKTTSSGAYTNSGISAMTYDSASSTRAMVYAMDSANSKYNQVNVYPTKTTMNKNLVLNGTTFTGSNKVLWTGGYYMSDSQTATLSEAISAQANGVVLVWSYYTDGASDNSNFNMVYIPKHFMTLHAGKGVVSVLTNSSMNMMCSKYTYISDTKITGYAGNDDASAVKDTGITTIPKNFVLRYVIGV